jgi:DNA-binding IclR family transcriptional regulator
MSRGAQGRATTDRRARSATLLARRAGDSTRPGVVDKVASLLVALAGENEALDLGEIAARTGINKSTACRILKRLAVHRLVDQDPGSGSYRLGLALFELGRRVGDTVQLSELARPLIESLARESGETAHFALLDLQDRKVVHLVRADSPYPVRAVPSQTGKGYPFHCLSVGKAIAAFLPEADRTQLLSRSKFERFTPRTITRRNDLKREFEKIRQLGYAVDDEEYYEGIRCVAVPVLGRADAPIGGLSLAGPTSRMTLGRLDELAALIGRAATELGNAISPELTQSESRKGLARR